MQRTSNAAQPIEHVARSGADGTFGLSGLGEGTYEVVARRTGFAPRTLREVVVSSQSDPLDLGTLVMSPGESVSGYVVATDGAAVSDVKVQIGTGPLVFLSDVVTQTDSTGWFLVPDLDPEMTYTLGLQRSGYVPQSVAGLNLPRNEPVRVELEQASEVNGVVVNNAGEPVPGASVQVKRARKGGTRSGQSSEATLGSALADDDGHFSFSVSPGVVSIVAQSKGYQEARRDGVELPNGKNVENLEIELVPGAIVEGGVVGPDGEPLTDARVKVVRSESAAFQFDQDVSDGDGKFELTGLAQGMVSIEATHRDFPRVTRQVDVGPGRNRVDLEFEGGVPLSGTVSSLDGDVVSGASVRLLRVGRSWGGTERQTDHDGTFRFAGVSDGDYRILVQAEGYAKSDGTECIVAGEPVTGLEIVLFEGGTIEGMIEGIAPESLDKVIVTASQSGFGEKAGYVNYQGRYRIDNLQVGEYRVQAVHEATGRQTHASALVEQ